MKVFVLGMSGMLGREVCARFRAKGHEVIGSSRSGGLLPERSGDVFPLNLPFHVPDALNNIPTDSDVVINCIGIIRHLLTPERVSEAIWINSYFPHILGDYCSQHGIKVIHITTDCVFSGLIDKRHVESDQHDASDIYGRSKSLGEPAKAMCIRTSVIGREKPGGVSLVSWVQSERGNTVNGFTNHYWNGITNRCFADVCLKVLEEDLYEEGIFHVFSPATVTKCELIEMISNALDLDVTVSPVETPNPCYRALGTEKSLCENLEIPEIVEQLADL